jgi:hypothetical protein
MSGQSPPKVRTPHHCSCDTVCFLGGGAVRRKEFDASGSPTALGCDGVREEDRERRDDDPIKQHINDRPHSPTPTLKAGGLEPMELGGTSSVTEPFLPGECTPRGTPLHAIGRSIEKFLNGMPH